MYISKAEYLCPTSKPGFQRAEDRGTATLAATHPPISIANQEKNASLQLSIDDVTIFNIPNASQDQGRVAEL